MALGLLSRAPARDFACARTGVEKRTHPQDVAPFLALVLLLSPAAVVRVALTLFLTQTASLKAKALFFFNRVAASWFRVS